MLEFRKWLKISKNSKKERGGRQIGDSNNSNKTFEDKENSIKKWCSNNNNKIFNFKTHAECSNKKWNQDL